MICSVTNSAGAQTIWIQTPSEYGSFEFAGKLTYDGRSMVALSIQDTNSIKTRLAYAAVALSGSHPRNPPETPRDRSECPQDEDTLERGIMIIGVTLGSVETGIIFGWLAAQYSK